jgi:hypothetical protein
MFTTFLAVLVMSPQHTRGHGHARHKAHVQKPVDEEPGIRAGYADVQKAFETKNWALFRSRVTSNFQEELPNHQVLNLKAAMASLRHNIDPLTETKARFNIQDTKITGSTATVLARFSADGKMKDKKGTHKVHSEGSETDSLKKVGGRWVAYYAKIHDQSTSVDGHVVSHMP